jgi:hypothetical protein
MTIANGGERIVNGGERIVSRVERIVFLGAERRSKHSLIHLMMKRNRKKISNTMMITCFH